MLSISILNVDKNDILKIDQLKTDYIHLDVMDNIFVPNKTNFIANKEIQKINHPLDIHFMVENIIKYVDEYKLLNPEYMTFHIEATTNPVLIIEHIKKCDIKVGIAINPDTDINKIKPYLNIIDLVLVMSVIPGYGGQDFIDITNKIKRLNDLKKEYNYKFLIEVDGGINNNNIKLLKDSDIIVVGSYITSSKNYASRLKMLQ